MRHSTTPAALTNRRLVLGVTLGHPRGNQKTHATILRPGRLRVASNARMISRNIHVVVQQQRAVLFSIIDESAQRGSVCHFIVLSR
jgi:hypothetical protein